MKSEREDCIKEFEEYVCGETSWSNSVRVPKYVLPVAFVFTLLLLGLIALVAIIVGMHLEEPSTNLLPYEILALLVLVTMIVIRPIAFSMNVYTEMNQQLGYQGLNRSTLTMMLSTLDQLYHGLPRISDWRTSDRNVMGLHQPFVIDLTIRNLKIIMPEEFEKWHQVIKDPLDNAENPLNPYIDDVLVFIGIVGLLSYFGLPLFVAVFGPPDFKILMTFLIAFAVFFVICILVIILDAKDTPKRKDRLRQYTETSEIKEATYEMITSYIATLQDVLPCPMQAYLIGQYPGALWTGRSLTSSTGVTLHECFILPHDIAPPPEWKELDSF
ncbi:MAG: hypothetical protein K9W43_11515 [Candidatus Thorarchaeota archaeon]|nr:hypothetical protein [Candidatus Thorarchaeota archaeon]